MNAGSGRATDALLNAVEAIHARDGLGAVTVRAVAARAGVAPMCIYHRFGGKGGLIDEWSSRGFRELAMAIAVRDESDPVGRLRQVGLRYRDFALRRPGVYVAMFDPGAGRPNVVAGDSSRTADVLRHFVSPIESGMAAGVFADADPQSVGQQAWCMVHGAVQSELRDPIAAPDPGRCFARLLALLIRGIRA